jgi:hypothetical protein
LATLRKAVRKTLSAGLGFAGFELLRRGERDYVKSFLPLRATLQAARKAGLSVGDYVDRRHQVPGATQAAIDQLAGLGVFDRKIQSICEVGPGSGRYLEKVQRLCAPGCYEIYETEREWSDWLVRNYHVKAHDADGKSLSQTASQSIDLAHAHKVFVYLPFVGTCQYFSEMVRVTRPGGYIVFDIVSEECMTDVEIDRWVSSATYYPCITPRAFVINFFARRGCSLRGSFFAPLRPGQSEYLFFVKGN